MTKTGVFLCTILAMILLTGCVESYETKTVEGIIIEKEHDKARTYYKTVTVDGEKKKKRVHEKEEFEVIIQYQDIKKEFEFKDNTFYKEVKIGDNIPVELVTGIDKEGKVVTEDIELIESLKK